MRMERGSPLLWSLQSPLSLPLFFCNNENGERVSPLMKSPISAISSPLFFVIMRMERGSSLLWSLQSPLSLPLFLFCNNENGGGVSPLMKFPVSTLSSPHLVIMRMERVSPLMKSPISALSSPLFCNNENGEMVSPPLKSPIVLSSCLSLLCGNEGWKIISGSFSVRSPWCGAENTKRK